MKLSFEQLKEKLQQMMPSMYIMEMYDDHVICEKDGGGYCRVDYKVDDAGNIVMGEPADVMKTYVPMKAQAAMRFTGAAVDGKEDYGYKWNVQIIDAGPDKQKRFEYPLDVIHAAAPLYEGTPVFVLTEAQHTAGKHPYGKPVRDIVGRISQVTTNSTGNEGIITILKSAKWFRDMIVDAYEQGMIGQEGQKDLLELSHDVIGQTIKAAGGISRVARIVKVDGVDVVYDAIGGGKFKRMAAAAMQAGQMEDNMWKRLLAALKGMRPDLAGQIDALLGKGDDVTDAEIQQMLAAAMPQQAAIDIEKLLAAMKSDISATDEAKKILDQARLVACGNTLAEELKGSGLPAPVQEKLRAAFRDKVFDTDTLRAAIKTEKEVLDKLTASGVITGAGDVRVMDTAPERIQAAMDKLFGVQVDAKFADVQAFDSFRASYVRITGDSEIRGLPTREGLKLGESIMDMMRLPAAYSSTSFSFVLGNSMYRRLIQDYKAVDYGEQNLVSYKRNAKDFKTMESINVGYFGDIPDVNPETADYTEVTMPTDEEITYTLNQKGIILTVTRKAIINDDLKTVVTMVQRLGRAARRTFARRLWNKIINNATYKGDSVALFHASHGNLGSTALTADATGIATLTARLTAMFTQTEKNSGEKLALDAAKIWVPRELLEVAKQLNSPWPGAAQSNPHAGRFGVNHENIFVNKLTTDANDWGLIANPADVELLEVAFLNGQEEPELFVADNPLIGQMFVADKIQYKQRHEYEAEIADYRGFDKSVVV